MTAHESSLTSESVNLQINELLLNGSAKTASEAEEMFLDAHLADLPQLVVAFADQDFLQHEGIKLLMSHGSRRLEGAIP